MHDRLVATTGTGKTRVANPRRARLPGRRLGTVIERAPNDWLRIRVESATGRFAGLKGRIMAGPIWGLEPEPS